MILPQIQFDFGGVEIEGVSEHLISLTVEESAYGGLIFAIQFAVNSLDKLNKIIGTKNHSGFLRYGYSEDGQSVQWSDESKIRCNMLRTSLDNPAAFIVNIRGTCSGYYDLMARRWTAYKNKTVSNIVKDIATKSGLGTNVTDTSEKLTFYQAGLSDWEFIGRVLGLYAGANNRSDFYFFVENGVLLNFRLPDLDMEPVKTLAYATYDAKTLPILASEMASRELDVARMGGFQTKTLGYNPLTKELLVKEMGDKDDKFPCPQGASELPTASGTINNDPQQAAIVILPEPEDYRDSTVKDYARSVWQFEGHSMYRVAVSTHPTVEIPLLSMVNLDVQGVLGGRYIVYGVSHHVTPSSWATVLKLERRSHRK